LPPRSARCCISRRRTRRSSRGLLLVAPMSGHFATLLRGQPLKTLLQDHDVYITDWHNPRDISAWPRPLRLGGLHRPPDHLLDKIGPRAHMVAICQPSYRRWPPRGDVGRQSSGPPGHADPDGWDRSTRGSSRPRSTNRQEQADQLVREENLINYVPVQCKGAFRKVYPASCSSPPRIDESRAPHQAAYRPRQSPGEGREREGRTHQDLLRRIFCRDGLPAEFYIETVRDVFQEHLLPQGKADASRPAGEPGLDQADGPDDVEAKNDDICSIGADAGSTGPLHRRARLPQGAPHAGRRRPLRLCSPASAGIQRDLSAAPGFRARECSEAGARPPFASLQ